MPPDPDSGEGQPGSDQDPHGVPPTSPPPLSPRSVRLWRIAIGLLIAATAVALISIGGKLRTVASGLSDGVVWAARGVGDGVGWAASHAADAGGDAGRWWSDAATRLQDLAATEPLRPVAALPGPEGSRSLFVVVTGIDGRGKAYALFAVSPEGEHSIVLFPPALRSIIPGYGDFPLSDAPLFEDAHLAALTVSNVLGVRVDAVLAFGPGDVERVLARQLEIDLPVALVVPEPEGGRVLADEGTGVFPAALVEAILDNEGEGGQLEWLQRQAAVWQALLGAVVSDPALVDRITAFAGDAGSLLLSAAGDAEKIITVVPVALNSVGNEEAYVLPRDEADQFVAERLPHLTLRQGDRPRVEVLNGNGRPQATRLVAETLVNRGFRVVKTDNARSFDFVTSQVISQGRDNRAAAEEVVHLLGVGELVLELRAPSGVVDVSIIVGQDIPSREE